MTIGVDDYRCLGLGYPCGQCTSLGLWRMRNDLGHPDFAPSWRGGWFGNASEWAYAARVAGLPFVGVPERGDLALFPAYTAGAGPFGHVAIILGGGGPAVFVEDLNWDDRGDYLQHEVQAGGLAFVRASSPQGGHVVFAVTVMRRATSGVHLREFPTPASPSVGFVWPGQELPCVGWARGPVETDLELGTPDSRWYQLASGPWISSAFVDGNAPGSTAL